MQRLACRHAVCLECIPRIIVDSSDEESSSDYSSEYSFIFGDILSDNNSDESFISKQMIPTVPTANQIPSL